MLISSEQLQRKWQLYCLILQRVAMNVEEEFEVSLCAFLGNGQVIYPSNCQFQWSYGHLTQMGMLLAPIPRFPFHPLCLLPWSQKDARHDWPFFKKIKRLKRNIPSEKTKIISANKDTAERTHYQGLAAKHSSWLSWLN